MERKDLVVLISSTKSGARSGKNSFAQFMIDYINDRIYKKHINENQVIIPQIIEFSSGLKDICRDVFCVPEEYVTGSFKEEPLSNIHDDFKVSIDSITDDASCRDIMRYLGTEVFRDKFGENVWVKRIHNKMCQFIAKYAHEDYCTITFIPDFRFNNELLYLKEKGWDCIWVDIFRPGQEISTLHRSENSLNLEYDKYPICNEGDLDQLKKDAENFIEYIIAHHFEPVGCC